MSNLGRHSYISATCVLIRSNVLAMVIMQTLIEPRQAKLVRSESHANSYTGIGMILVALSDLSL